MRATTPILTTTITTATTTKTIAATALLGAIKTAKPNRARSAHLARLPFSLWHFECDKRVKIKERIFKYRCVVALILTNLINKLRNAYAALMHSCTRLYLSVCVRERVC